MRILHSCLRYPPATGGVETYVKEIVERTRNLENGLDVRVLTSKLRTHHPASELDPSLLINDPPYIQRLHHINTPVFAYPRLQALEYYLGHHKPDLIHSYSYWYHPADASARYARRNSIPFIFHPIFYTNKIRQKPVWNIYNRTIGKKTFATADITVVISPYEQRLITREQMPVKRFELIPPGVDQSRFNNTTTNPFTSRGLSGNILLSVGRIAPGKGLEDLIETLPDIIKACPQTHLVIIGEDFGLSNSLQQKARLLGVQKNLHLWGKVEDSILTSAYQHANLFIHPSHYEAFGIVIAESLSAGTPVLARNVTAIPYVCPHEKTGLLFNNNEELLRHTTALLANQSLREQYGIAGKKHITENFSWDNSIKKLTGLYQELAK